VNWYGNRPGTDRVARVSLSGEIFPVFNSERARAL